MWVQEYLCLCGLDFTLGLLTLDLRASCNLNWRGKAGLTQIERAVCTLVVHMLLAVCAQLILTEFK